MAAPRTTLLVAAVGAGLTAVGILSANTTGWWGIAAGLTFWAGVAGLVTAAVFVARDRRALSGILSRAGFLLVVAGLLALLAGVGVIVEGTLNPSPCPDTDACAPPGSEMILVLGTIAAVLLLAGAAILLAGLSGVRDRAMEE